jgi:nucleoside-diphosphate-sugar epimerase
LNGQVLVTGAAGKLGANLVRRLTERGQRVRALVLPDDPGLRRIAPFEPEVVRGDFADLAVAERAVAGVDRIVNLASIGHYARDDQHFYATDTVGTYNLLWAAAKQGGLARFVQASSTVSYGPVLYEPTDETHPQRPDSCLGVTKLTAENLCEQFRRQHGLPTTRLRFTWVHAGPDFLTYQFRVPAWLNRARRPAPRAPRRPSRAWRRWPPPDGRPSSARATRSGGPGARTRSTSATWFRWSRWRSRTRPRSARPSTSPRRRPSTRTSRPRIWHARSASPTRRSRCQCR